MGGYFSVDALFLHLEKRLLCLSFVTFESAGNAIAFGCRSVLREVCQGEAGSDTVDP